MDIRATIETAPPGAGERAGGRRPAHVVAVAALTGCAAAFYSVFALGFYHTFQTSSYDLVIFDQAVRSYAHFHPGVSVVKGIHNFFGPNFSVLGDHWSPILAVLAPLYWIHGSPVTLLVAQAVLFALAIPPLWVFTRRAFGGGGAGEGGNGGRGGGKAVIAAYLVCVAYALSWPIASALAFDFHEVAFAPVLTAVALERLQAGRLRAALIALGALLLVKEDMGLLVAGIGIYLALSRPRVVRRQLTVGAALVVAGLAATVISTYVLIPAFGGRASYYWAYSALGPHAPQAAWHLITHPSSLKLLVTPEVKLQTMLWLFGAFCFLSLRSPLALAAVPLLLERMLANTFPNWWVTSYQYNAYLVVILVFAAVDGAARLDHQLLARQHRAARTGPVRPAEAGAAEAAAGDQGAVGPSAVPSASRGQWWAGPWSVGLACAAAMCAVAVALVPHFAFGAAFHTSFYRRDAQMNAAAAAVAAVPSGVTVEAVNNLGPQLSGRDTVLLWDGDGGTPPLGAPWVVAYVASRQFTWHSVAEQRQRIAFLERNGYRVVFRRSGYLVLHRAGLGPGSRVAASGQTVTGAAG
jgi:uncharacterized membrane protein